MIKSRCATPYCAKAVAKDGLCACIALCIFTHALGYAKLYKAFGNSANPACWFYLALYLGAAAVNCGCIKVGTSITWMIGDHCRITPGSLPCGSLIALDMHALLLSEGEKKKKKSSVKLDQNERELSLVVSVRRSLVQIKPSPPFQRTPETHRSTTIYGFWTPKYEAYMP